MPKIKDAKIIYPVSWSDIGIDILPSRNDVHNIILNTGKLSNCKYSVRGMFYDISSDVYILLNNISPMGENCWGEIIIKAKIDTITSINLKLNFGDLVFKDSEKLSSIYLPEIPRWDDNIIVNVSNNIYVFSCKEIIIRPNEPPEIIVQSCRIFKNITDIFSSYIGASAVWPV